MLLTKYFSLAKEKAWILLLLLPIASAIEISVSYLLQIITDTATGQSRLSYFNLVWIVIVYILLDATVYFASTYLEQISLNQIITEVRNQLLNSLFHHKIGMDHDLQQTTNDYYNDLTSTIDILRDDYLQGNLNAYKQICQFVIALVLSLLIKPILSLAIVLLCIPGILLPFYQKKHLQTNKRNTIEQSQKLTSNLQNMTAGLKTIQLFNIQKQLQNIFRIQNGELLSAQNQDQLTRKQIGGLSQLLDNVLYLGTWVIGIYFVMHKQISLGQLVAFSQLMIFISEPIQSASGLISGIIGGKAAAETIDQKLMVPNKISSKKLAKIKTIKYADVSIFHHEQDILKHITMNLTTSKHYIIVGKSGSGKTTLLNLPLSNSHQISINDTNIDQYQSSNIFNHLGLLEQHSYIFDDTIKNNLTLYNSNYSDAQLFKMLQQLDLNKYANVEGLQQKINSKSNLLSGGERRRLALGRILLKENDFNFFDEPLTGLDPKTARKISQVLINLTSGWLMVTHQYDQQLFEDADQIIILENGTIKTSGDIHNPIILEQLKELNLLPIS